VQSILQCRSRTQDPYVRFFLWRYALAPVASLVRPPAQVATVDVLLLRNSGSSGQPALTSEERRNAALRACMSRGFKCEPADIYNTALNDEAAHKAADTLRPAPGADCYQPWQMGRLDQLPAQMQGQEEASIGRSSGRRREPAVQMGGAAPDSGRSQPK
jgi:hypothetical protein